MMTLDPAAGVQREELHCLVKLYRDQETVYELLVFILWSS